MAKARVARTPVVKASAERMDLNDREAVRKTLARSEDWMEAASDYVDSIGELGDIVRAKGNTMSQLVLYVADVPDDRESPLEPTTNETAAQSLSRLDEMSDGLPELQREIGELATITGDLWLVGRMERENSPEHWWVASPQEVHQGEPVRVSDPNSDALLSLRSGDDSDYLTRMWRPHPMRGAQAWSPIQGILGPCELLLVMERALRAIGRNRAGLAGIALIASELGRQADDEDPDSKDGFLEDIYEALNAALQDEGSASAIAPIVVRADAELIETKSAIQHVPFPRDFDEMLLRVIELCERRIAQGLNIPPEEMFGLGSATHWGAGQIERSAFARYDRPDAVWLCNALTKGYLRPDLQANSTGLDPSRFRVWFNADHLVTDSAVQKNALDVFRVGELSGAKLREVYGFAKEDAPTDEERERRIVERRVRREPERIEAAGKRTVPAGDRLAEIDRNLQIRLHAEAEAQMLRALERAGNRIKAQCRSTNHETRGLPPTRIAAALGRKVVATLGTPDELLKDAWVHLHQRFEALVHQAQESTLDVVKMATPATDEDLFEDRLVQEQDRKAAWQWLENALSALAMDRLFDPNPRHAGGEHDPNSLVPFALIREAVSRAGGQDA